MGKIICVAGSGNDAKQNAKNHNSLFDEKEELDDKWVQDNKERQKESPGAVFNEMFMEKLFKKPEGES